MTVLVADDEPALLRLVTRLLEPEGFRVLPAADGTEAAALLATADPCVELVLLDAGLRPQGADPILKTIAEEGLRVGAVLMSGSRLSDAARGLLDVCGGRYIAKPFAPDDLVEALRAVAPA